MSFPQTTWKSSDQWNCRILVGDVTTRRGKCWKKGLPFWNTLEKTFWCRERSLELKDDQNANLLYGGVHLQVREATYRHEEYRATMTLRLHPVAAQRLGDAIRRNKGDVHSMMKAVEASLLHSNSSETTSSPVSWGGKFMVQIAGRSS